MASLKQPSVRRKNSSEKAPTNDAVLSEVYAIRDAYAAEHNHNLDRIYADLKRREVSSHLRRTKSSPRVSV